MKRIIIEIRGGVMQAVYCNEAIQVTLVDWDEREDDPSASCAHKVKMCALHFMPEETKEVSSSPQ